MFSYTQDTSQNWLFLFTLKYFTDVQPEVNPKWQVLSDILEEVDGLSKHAAKRDPSCSNMVLVLVEDSRTCNQLKQVGNVFKRQHEFLYNYCYGVGRLACSFSEEVFLCLAGLY